MPAIMAPKAVAEAPMGGGGNRPFPTGDWVGTIEEVRVRNFPDFIDPISRPKGGYASTDGEIVSIQLGSNSAVEDGQDDPGAQKFFVDFVVRDGSAEISDMEIDDKSWQMQRSQNAMLKLAIALGITEVVTDEEGNEFVTTPEDFLDRLRNEDLNGSVVGFNVYHRAWESKASGKSGTEARLGGFFEAA